MTPGWAIAITALLAVVVLGVIAYAAISGDVSFGEFALIAFVALTAGFFVWILAVRVPLDAENTEGWKQDCVTRGGQVIEHSEVRWRPAGKVLVRATDTDYACISPDGELLGVRS